MIPKFVIAAGLDSLSSFVIETPIMMLLTLILPTISNFNLIIFIGIFSTIVNFTTAFLIYYFTYKPEKLTDQRLYITGAINTSTMLISHIIFDLPLLKFFKYFNIILKNQVIITNTVIYISDFLLTVLGTLLIWKE